MKTNKREEFDDLFPPCQCATCYKDIEKADPSCTRCQADIEDIWDWITKNYVEKEDLRKIMQYAMDREISIRIQHKLGKLFHKLQDDKRRNTN